MSVWRATKAKRVYAALLRLGWTLKKQVGSHRKLQKPGHRNFTFCFRTGATKQTHLRDASNPVDLNQSTNINNIPRDTQPGPQPERESQIPQKNFTEQNQLHAADRSVHTACNFGPRRYPVIEKSA